MEKRKIFKLSDGRFTDMGSLWCCRMFWDEYGTYVGQEQINLMDEPGEGPETLFFAARGNEEPVKYALTADEMANATIF